MEKLFSRFRNADQLTGPDGVMVGLEEAAQPLAVGVVGAAVHEEAVTDATVSQLATESKGGEHAI